MAPSRVQGNGTTVGRGTATTGNSVSVTSLATPGNNNLLIAVIGVVAVPAITVSSITQSGVNWSTLGAGKQVSKTADSNYVDCEIWVGIVEASGTPGTAITVNFSGTINYGAVVDVCEYSGLKTSGFLDKTNTANGSSTSTATGATGTLSQASELIIGALCNYKGSQSTPTNGFALLDGAQVNSDLSVAYLELIVSATTTQSSGTTAASTIDYAGCIASFEAPASITNINLIDNCYGSDADPACPFNIFADDFAGGTPAAWSGTQQIGGGTLQVLASAAHSGPYGCEVGSVGNSTTSETYLNTTPTTYAAMHSRFYVRFNSANCIPAASGQVLNLLEHINGSNWHTITAMGLGWDASLPGPCIFLQCADGATYDYPLYDFTPVIAQWYCFELYTVISTTGGAFVFMNGQLILSDWVVDTTQYGQIGQFEFGIPYSNIPLSFTIDFGDCIVSNGYIGPMQPNMTGSLPLTDSGQGSDDVNVQNNQEAVQVSDSGLGSDALSSMQTQIPVSDAGEGADNVAVQGMIPVSDVSSGTDAVANLQGQVPVCDSGLGSDFASLAGQVPITDSGEGSDMAVVGSPVPVSDSGAGCDSASIIAQIPLTDLGLGTDSIAVGSPVNLSDSGLGSDVMAIQAQILVNDRGASLDSAIVNVTTLLSDVGLGSDALAIAMPIALSDTGLGADTIIVTVPRLSSHAVVIQSENGKVTFVSEKGQVVLKSDSD